DLLGHIGVLVGQRAVQEFHDPHIHAVVAQDVAELHPDGAGADDQDRTGQIAGEDLLLVGDDIAAQRGTRQQFGLGAGGDDDIVEGDRLRTALAEFHRDGVGIGERPLTVVFGDLVLLHQEMDALDPAVRDLTAPVERRPEIERRLPGDTEGFRFLGEDMSQLRIAQQRLGRDAAHVQAYATPVFLLDDRCSQAELSGADRGDVTAGTSTENDDIVVGSHGVEPNSLPVAEPTPPVPAGEPDHRHREAGGPPLRGYVDICGDRSTSRLRLDRCAPRGPAATGRGDRCRSCADGTGPTRGNRLDPAGPARPRCRLRSGAALDRVSTIHGVHDRELRGELDRVPMRSLVELWQLLAHTGPGAGLAVAADAPLGSLSTWDYLVTTGSTLADSLAAAQPYPRDR